MMMKKNDNEIEAEATAVLADRKRLSQEQRAARHARLNNPAKAEEVAEARAALEIARALYEARKAARLTQKELAERMNTSQSFIARMERGRGNITIQTVARYASAWGKRIALI